MLDANALDDCKICNNKCLNTLLALHKDGMITLILPKLVLDEINHEHTPQKTKDRAIGISYTLPVNLTALELQKSKVIQNHFQGNAINNKHSNDANHVFETQKYGASYFISEDKRVLKKAPKTGSPRAISRHDFIIVLKEFKLI